MNAPNRCGIAFCWLACFRGIGRFCRTPAGNVKRGNSRKRRAAGVPGGHVSRLTVGFTMRPLIGILSRSLMVDAEVKGSRATHPASQCRGAERETPDLRNGERPMSFPSWPVNQYSGSSRQIPAQPVPGAWMTLQAEQVIAHRRK